MIKLENLNQGQMNALFSNTLPEARGTNVTIKYFI